MGIPPVSQFRFTGLVFTSVKEKPGPIGFNINKNLALIQSFCQIDYGVAQLMVLC